MTYRRPLSLSLPLLALLGALSWLLLIVSSHALAVEHVPASVSNVSNPSDAPSAAQRAAFARQVITALEATDAQLVLLARMGRPLREMPEGMRFTHVGLAERTAAGYVIHNLYQYDDAPDRSHLVDDEATAFFSEVAALEAGLLIPSPALQQRLLAIIHSPTYAALHDPRYSLIANPFTLGRQNCTEFILDVIFAAHHQTTDPAQLKRLQQAEFVAEPVRVNPIKLLLAGLFRREVAIIDQPAGALTATFERIAAYLAQVDVGSRVEYMRFAGAAGTSPLADAFAGP
ncbi:MAG: DUF2145 domain-containing protein [Sterolibacterium sp.]|nr:DUF2145 domain-containing protein [Sterolibacterium sp.]